MTVQSLALKPFALDPAVGSGPLATVLQDLFSIWVYLIVTTLAM
jgi:Mg/Co/Ni transporter MgtE